MAKSGLPPGGAASGTELDRGPAAAGALLPPVVHKPGPASARFSITEAAAALTLDDAIRVARSIQRDLDAGKIGIPYPDQVRRSLFVCLTVFAREGVSTKTAQAIVARLEAAEDPADTVTPAWA